MRPGNAPPSGITGTPSASALPSDDRVRPRLDTLVRLSAPSAAVPLHRAMARAIQSGQYLSRFKGRGMEFAESRPYIAGDDVRSLDWRVTARTGRVHTKLFREERERPVLLAVDGRASMFFGTRHEFKFVTAARLAALIAWSAHHHGDRVGGLVFSEHARAEVKPEQHRRSVLNLLQHLADAVPGHGPGGAESAGLEEAIGGMERHARTGSLMFLFSDFRGFDDGIATRLSRLRRHGEAVLIAVYDPLERSVPSSGRYRFSDGFNERSVNFSPDAAREHRRRFEDRLQRLQSFARGNRMRVIVCATDEDPLRTLQRGMAADHRHL
ncbi:DUF58 domain-containing protein [Methylolobus aquaticus]|nr:DUF58 domain-containing protein [Methylolobus aquaticus]